MAFLALEDALSLARHEIEAVEEGELSFGRGPGADEENGIALLPQNAFAVGQSARERRTRIAVTVANGALPDERGLRAGFRDVEQESTLPAAVAIVIMGQAETVFRPLDGGTAAGTKAPAGGNKALLKAGELLRLISEWSAQKHELVAELGFRFGIAAVKRLCPNECCRLRGHPLIVAWASQH